MSKVIHTRRFADGKETPQEMHARVAWAGKRCLKCGGKPHIVIRVIAPLKELQRLCPEVLMAIAAGNPDPAHRGEVPVIPTVYGPMLRVSEVVACRLCAPDAEKAAAHGPSWTIVELDRGPDPKGRVVVGWEG